MTAYSTWLSARAKRVLLAVLVADDGTEYVAHRTYVTGAADSLPNTVFDGVIVDADVEWQIGAALGRSGRATGGDLVIANPAGSRDHWVSRTWRSVTYRYGDPAWGYDDFRTILHARVDGIEADDDAIRFRLRDRYEELANPIQTVFPVPSPSAALLYPICYGYPRNITPIITEPNAAPEYRIGEPPCEDAAVTRYLNQAAFTSPGIAKINALAQFDLDADPNGRVTVDAKGKLDGSNTWIQTLGAALKDALIRTHGNETGVLEGGSSTTIVLPDSSSDVDDHYNGKTVRKWVKEDAAVGDHTSAESRTITDYDGATRTATVNSAWTAAAKAADVYQIQGETVQAGPLTESDLDTASFTAFDVAYPYLIGLFVDDGSTSAHQLLNLALSPGAYHTWSTGLADGESRVTIGVLRDPSGVSADFELTASDLIGNLERIQDLRRTKRLRLGFLKNHTVASEAHEAGATRSAFATEEYRYIAKGSFRPGVDEEEADRTIPTLIVDEDDAYTELDRLWALFSVQRYTYACRANLKVLEYGIGAIVQVTDDRHELSGKNLVVTGIRLRPIEGVTDVELWG